MKPFVIQSLSVRDLRNLQQVDLEPSGSTNVLCGDNGQGKTSLLEAIYLSATSRSFRTHRVRDLIRHSAPACSVRARFRDSLGSREQFIALSATQRVLQVDGQKPESVTSFAVRSPVVVFHPGELELTMGAALGRRTLLDRVALFLDPQSYLHHQAYVQAMRARQKLLQLGASVKALEAYEQLMAEHGSALTRHRAKASELLSLACQQAFVQLAPEKLQMAMHYAPGGSENAEEAQGRLVQDREKDRHRSGPSFGPQRDDLVLELAGRSARVVASQGQHRVLTLSLKIAEMSCIASACGVNPLLLLDDVSSELDAQRTQALFALLGQRKDQVFITTTRPEMLQGLEQAVGDTRVFEVQAGAVRQRAE